MNNFKTSMMVASALIAGSVFTACSNDDGPSYSSTAVTNTELKTILTGKGYEFNEQGNLLLNDLANNTTSLDLSGTKLSDFSGLTILPNLTEVNLSNNEYGPIFDFSTLPEQITGVDLTGNKVYDFEGLVDAKVENDEVKATILHKLTKLYLPETAKYNVEDLMPFYTQNKADGTTVDMQMAGADGKLQAYTTLREIPDEYFRTYLKTKFASLFANDTQIDISKPMGLEESGKPITLNNTTQFANMSKIESIEGIEYFINNPYYAPFYISITYNTPFNIYYLAPRNNIKGLLFSSISFSNGMDLSKATSLSNLQIKNNDDLIELDLSKTLISNQEISAFDSNVGNLLKIENCTNLKSLIFPSAPVGITSQFELINLPSLVNLNLDGIKALELLVLLKLNNCSITFPNLQYRFTTSDKQLISVSDGGKILFAISEDVFNMDATHSFIQKYKNNLTDRWILYRSKGAYMWSSNI